MKLLVLAQQGIVFPLSPPSRGAWIEMPNAVALPAKPVTSPPSRGAWIEISIRPHTSEGVNVAPLAGGVD